MTRWHIDHTKLNMRVIRKLLRLVKNYRIHIVCWIVFILYENLLLIGMELQMPDLKALVFHSAANVTFFYVFARVILNWAWRSDVHDWWRIPFGVAVSLIAFMLLKFLLDDVILIQYEVKQSSARSNIKIFSGYLYRGVFFMLCALGYCYLFRFIKERQQRQMLLVSYFNELTLSSNGKSPLQQRLPGLLYTHQNMHHLFSCLNFIYLKLADKDPNLALFSYFSTDLVRYYIDPDTARSTKLEKELILVSNLIKMDQIMFPEKMPLRLKIEKGIKDMDVSATALIPLTILLLRFSTAKIKSQSNRGVFSILMLDGQLCSRGSDIQCIDDSGSLKVAFEQLKVQMLTYKKERVRFEYEIIHDTLNFEAVF